MQKLTNEKARELLKELQYAKAAMGQLSIKDEYFKQALERMPQWFKDSPPMSGEYICNIRGTVMPASYDADEDTWTLVNHHGEHYLSDEEVISWMWMPLPEAP